jgi:hypothetical protein
LSPERSVLVPLQHPIQYVAQQLARLHADEQNKEAFDAEVCRRDEPRFQVHSL